MKTKNADPEDVKRSIELPAVYVDGITLYPLGNPVHNIRLTFSEQILDRCPPQHRAAFVMSPGTAASLRDLLIRQLGPPQGTYVMNEPVLDMTKQ